MSDILSILLARPLGEIVALAVLIIGIIWALAFAVVWTIKKVKVHKIGGVEMGQEQPELQPGQSPHAICLHGQDIVRILRKQAETLNAISEIRHSIIPQQMRYMESRAAELRGSLQKTFLAVMEGERVKGNTCEENFVDTSDYRIYWMCLRIVQDDLREFFRICFRENHLASKSESEFRSYIETITREALQKATDTLNELYHGTVVTRAMVYEANKAIIPELDEGIEDVLLHARAIALKSLSDVKIKQDEFDAFFQKHMGTGGPI